MVDVLTYFKTGRRSSASMLRKAKAQVRERSKGWCEVRVSGVCEGRAIEFHHRLMKSQGGPDTADNGLDACVACHDYIHHHPDEAYRRGWLFRRLA